MSTFAIVAIIAGGLTALVAIGVALRSIVRVVRRLGHFVDDWFGEPARDGRKASPGVMSRLDAIETRLGSVEHELKPNSGLSLRDAVDRVEVAVTDDPPTTRR